MISWYKKNRNLIDILNNKQLNKKLLILFILVLWKNSYSDTIILMDKSQLVGKIISSNDNVISLTNNSLGQIDIPKHNILSIKKNRLGIIRTRAFKERYFGTINSK